MRTVLTSFLLFGASTLGLLGGCNNEDPDLVDPEPAVLEFDFESGPQGWTAGFTDLPDPPVADFETHAEAKPLPAPLDQSRRGFMITGTNHSDDLFMFLTRRLTAEDGIVPNQPYEVSFTFSFASNASDCAGVGGSPGESVFMKVGASPEPAVARLQNGQKVFSLDKGNQSEAGNDATLAGNVATGRPCQDYPYVLLERTVQHTNVITADGKGELSVFIGTDSGFEGKTTLYYDHIAVELTPVSEK
jgi:hypothetical protein